MATTRGRPAFASPGRAAHAWTCRRCDAPTWTGLDGDTAARNVKVDSYPISNTGEIAALISGRETYYLRWIPGRARYEIDRRDAFDIKAISADKVGANADERIVVEHRCGYPRVDGLRTVVRFGRKTSGHTNPADPPF